MKRFLVRIGRLFWSWRTLKVGLWLVTLVILFYAEEDWRGARRWETVKKTWEARGETFDLNRFTPPPIPENQNLESTPLSKLERRNAAEHDLQPLRLQGAMRQDLPGNDLPPLNAQRPDGLPDMGKIREVIARNYGAAFNGIKPPASTLEQFEALYPFLHDFLEAAAARSLCRLPEDYVTELPAARPLGPVVAGIRLSKILTVHAVVALDERQPGLALADIEANYTILSGMKRDPTLVGGLVAIGMTAINQVALRDGLVRHLWSDDQLREIDRILRPLNFLADYRFAMRCEAAESVTNMEWFASRSRQGGLDALRGLFGDEVPWMSRLPVLWPHGWWEQNMAQMGDYLLNEVSTVDPQARRVFPQIDLDLKERVQQASARGDANAPWNIFFTTASPPLTDSTIKYAVTQTRIDQARIAIALERYRLVHHAYPGSLDLLTPAFIDTVPRDVMNGESYHYRRQDAGSYLLYSVGWDLADQGGAVVYGKDEAKRQVFEQGDWPWVTLPPTKP